LPTPAAIPIEVTLKKSARWAVVVALAGFLVGMLFKLGAAAGQETSDFGFSRSSANDVSKRWGSHVGRTLIWASVGLVGAALAGLWYFSGSATWGATDQDSWKLAIATATAAMSGAVFVHGILPAAPGAGQPKTDDGTRAQTDASDSAPDAAANP
jgi:hypothetical protein